MQSRTAALIEKVSETTAGFALNFTILNWLLNPFFDAGLHAAESLGMTSVFTLLSFGRGYVFRRIFTVYSHKIERIARIIRRERNMTQDAIPPYACALHFEEASVVPRHPGRYLVITELGSYLPCMADFTSDGQFVAFHADPPERRAPFARDRVLAWARLPDTRDVIARLYKVLSESTTTH